MAEPVYTGTLAGWLARRRRPRTRELLLITGPLRRNVPRDGTAAAFWCAEGQDSAATPLSANVAARGRVMPGSLAAGVGAVAVAFPR